VSPRRAAPPQPRLVCSRSFRKAERCRGASHRSALPLFMYLRRRAEASGHRPPQRHDSTSALPGGRFAVAARQASFQRPCRAFVGGGSPRRRIPLIFLATSEAWARACSRNGPTPVPEGRGTMETCGVRLYDLGPSTVEAREGPGKAIVERRARGLASTFCPA